MNNQPVNNRIEKFYRLFSVVITLIVLAVSYFLFDAFSRGITIDTDLRALLPESRSHSISRITNEKMFAQFGNKIIVATQGKNSEDTRAAIESVSNALNQQSNGLLKVVPAINEQSADLFEQLKPYRFHLLTNAQKERIAHSESQLVEDAWRALFSFESITHTSAIKNDPLSLFNDYLKSLTAMAAEFSYAPPFILINQGDKHFAVLVADVSQNALSLSVQEQITTLFETIESDLAHNFTNVELLKSGMTFHAAEAAATAKQEIAYITLISVLGIIALYMIAFRSLLPLLLSLLSVGFGWICAFAICHYLFSGLHIITLVFGATLIGISIDYSLHYFAKLYKQAEWDHKFKPLGAIISAIALDLTTSVLGYGSLILAPLPGLSQVAVFSITGLICSWLFAVTIYPQLKFKRKQTSPTWLIEVSLLPQKWWHTEHMRGPVIFMLSTVILSSILFSIFTQFSDNPRLLHNPSQQLIKNDQTIQQALKRFNANQFVVISAETEQATLQEEERFTQQLDQLVAQDSLGAYQAITQYVPSIKSQEENYTLLKDKLYHTDSVLTGFLNELGYEQLGIDKHFADFAAAKENYLTPTNWPGASIGEFSMLWLGEVDGEYVSVILLRDLQDVTALEQLVAANAHASLINKTERLQQILGEQQEHSLTLLVIAYCIVIMVLTIRYRTIKAGGLVLVPIASTLVTLALFGVLDTPVTLFHTFALFLILGLGLDYTIFIYESNQEDHSAHLAIMLSALTSCLSFGMLALSQTPMVSNFGCAILIGSLLNLLLAPFVALLRPATADSATIQSR